MVGSLINSLSFFLSFFFFFPGFVFWAMQIMGLNQLFDFLKTANQIYPWAYPLPHCMLFEWKRSTTRYPTRFYLSILWYGNLTNSNEWCIYGCWVTFHILPTFFSVKFLAIFHSMGLQHSRVQILKTCNSLEVSQLNIYLELNK